MRESLFGGDCGKILTELEIFHVSFLLNRKLASGVLDLLRSGSFWYNIGNYTLNICAIGN